MSGKIVEILIAPTAGAKMQSVNEAVLESGKGIFGDRYYEQKGTFSKADEIAPANEVTLIEKEKIDEFNKEFNLSLAYSDFRRNIVISNCDLNSLVDKEFQIGNVVLKGIRLCEPCSYLSTNIDEKTLMDGMQHKAGLRACVIKNGNINLSSQLEK